MAWDKHCIHITEGGFGIRDLSTLNSATNIMICRDLLNSKEDWAFILRHIVLISLACINHHISSSLYNGIKNEFQVIKDNVMYLISNGHKF